MPLVDTRSLIQYKTNIITYGKKHDSILAYADAPDDQSFSSFTFNFREQKKNIGLGKWAGGQVEKEDFLTE